VQARATRLARVLIGRRSCNVPSTTRWSGESRRGFFARDPIFPRKPHKGPFVPLPKVSQLQEILVRESGGRAIGAASNRLTDATRHDLQRALGETSGPSQEEERKRGRVSPSCLLIVPYSNLRTFLRCDPVGENLANPGSGSSMRHQGTRRVRASAWRLATPPLLSSASALSDQLPLSGLWRLFAGARGDLLSLSTP